MKINYRYFLVESGELLEKCRERFDRVHAARIAASKFAESLGAIGYYDSFDGRVWALEPSPGKAPPPGWRRDRKGRWVPSGGKRNKEVQAQIDALPPIPVQHPHIGDPAPSQWIDFEPSHRYECPGGHGWRALPLCQHVATHSAHALLVPAIEHGLTFPVPTGCREITKAEWELICAQAAVDAERRRAA